MTGELTPHRVAAALGVWLVSVAAVIVLLVLESGGGRAQRSPEPLIGVGADVPTILARATPTSFAALGRIRCSTYGPTVGCTVLVRGSRRGSITVDAVDLTRRGRPRFHRLVLPAPDAEPFRRFHPRVFLRDGMLHVLGSFICESYRLWVNVSSSMPFCPYPVVACTSVPSGHRFVIGRQFHVLT